MISAGPWHVEFHGPRTTIVCQDQGSQSALAEVFSMRGVGEREANAQLIAAAADLLDGCNALLGLLQLISYRDDVSDALRDVLLTNHRVIEAKAAIAKATGAA